jgi:hypothetical protein
MLFWKETIHQVAAHSMMPCAYVRSTSPSDMTPSQLRDARAHKHYCRVRHRKVRRSNNKPRACVCVYISRAARNHPLVNYEEKRREERRAFDFKKVPLILRTTHYLYRPTTAARGEGLAFEKERGRAAQTQVNLCRKRRGRILPPAAR